MEVIICHIVMNMIRIYEGYSGGLILRGVPYKSIETIRDAAKPYGTIVE